MFLFYLLLVGGLVLKVFLVPVETVGVFVTLLDALPGFLEPTELLSKLERGARLDLKADQALSFLLLLYFLFFLLSSRTVKFG